VADQGKGMKGLSIRNLSNEPASPKARTQGEGGSGIGLALCKDLLELNGEKIDIKSEEDKGTTVRFSIKK
jgi:signal transduction histidine kinase